MELIRTDRKTVNSILDFTSSVISKHGSRAPGSQGSICAAGEIAKSMELFCSTVRRESFTMHPGSVFNIGKIIGAAYVLSVLLLILGGVFCYISLCLTMLAFTYALIHYFFYGTLFDRLFKRKTGCNVSGTLEPEEEVKKQVIVIGHHDSALTFSFFSHFEKLAGIRLILAIIFYIFIMIVSVVFSVSMILGGTAAGINGILLILALAGLLFAIPLIFFISSDVSPGAGDNLNGSSIAAHIGKYFADKKYNLQNTRLIILSTDGEEAGQRGAIDFARKHKEELKSIPTYVINVDSIYKKRELAVMLRDRHGLVPLSAELAEICSQTANKLEYCIKNISFPFGSGTDAAAFARIGVKSVSLIAMSTSLFEKGHTYHTMNDTVENIEPEAVEAVFNIAANAILRIDKEI